MEKLFKSKKVFIILGSLCVLTLFSVFQITHSEPLAQTGTKVEPNTELIYYLDIYYDGVDRYGNKSADNKVADITSKTISINDTLPDGLIFNGFIGSEDGSIGAVKRSDGSVCAGYVVDGVKGITYDSSTRNVSFNIKNMQAGCKITVGIRTTTPILKSGETRKDFYNTAYGKELNQSVKSNTVHVWMGQESAPTYTVTYKYEGTIPDNAPRLPDVQEYSANSSVVLANGINVEGYNFSGWKVSDNSVSIKDGQFTMPSKNITLVGTFTEKEKFSVTYEIQGDAPSDYVAPSSKNYYKDTVVTLDSLREGTEIDEYRFLGWTTNDVILSSEKDFEIKNNVTFIGTFEEIKYNVSYKFQGESLPPNVDKYLPVSKQYKPGDIVKLEEVIYSGNDFAFLGWYQEDNFIMPSEDVVIVGEWTEHSGIFEPQISIDVFANSERTNKKEYYRVGDTVYYKIIVSNPYDFDLTDVMIEEPEKYYFSDSESYELKTEHLAFLERLLSKSSVELYVEYMITSDDSGYINNEVEIIGALADANYVLNDKKEYKANIMFKVLPIVDICKVVVDESSNRDDFRFHIEGEKYDGWIKVSNGKCEKVYLEEGNYKISEVISQEYSLQSITLTKSGNISVVNNGSQILVDMNGNQVLTFTNKYKKKHYYHSSGTVENRVLAAQKESYVVNYYYDDIKIKSDTGNMKIGEIIPYNAEQETMYNGRHYILEKIEGKDKLVTSNLEENIVNVYYTIDEIVDLSLPSLDIGDGIPDKYQIVVNFVAVNGTVTPKSTIITKYKDGVPNVDGMAFLKAENIPVSVSNSGYTDGTWDRIPAVGLEVFDGDTFTITFKLTSPINPIDPINPTPPS